MASGPSPSGTPCPSPGGGTPSKAGVGRTREQLLKLLETSAKKLKQFDRKYGEAKSKIELLQSKIREKEEENQKIARAAGETSEAIDQKDDAIRMLSGELTNLQHQHDECKRKVQELEAVEKEAEEKLRAKAELILAAEQEKDEERRKVDDLLCKVQSLDAQLEERRNGSEASPSPGDGRANGNQEAELEVVKAKCKVLEERCAKLADSETQAADELEQRMQKMQEEEKRLNYLGSQVKSLQAEVDVAADRAQSAESQVTDLQAKFGEVIEENERLSKRLEASEAQLAAALMEAATAAAPPTPELSPPEPEKAEGAESLEIKADLDKAMADLAAERMEKESIAEELRSSRTLLKESNATNEKAKTNVEDLKRKFLVTAKKKQVEFNSKLEALRAKLKEKEDENAALADKMKSSEDQLTQTKDKAKTEGAEAVKAAADLRAEKENLGKRVDELEGLVEKQKHDIASLESARATAEEKEGQKEDTQKKKLKAVILELKRKLEKVDKLRQRDQSELAKMKESLRDEETRMLQAEETSSHEKQRLESELKTYKARAHMLLQQKEDQLKNTVSNEMADRYKDRIASLEAENEDFLGSRKAMERALAEAQERHAAHVQEVAEAHRADLAAKEEEVVGAKQEGKMAAEDAHQALEEAREELSASEKAHGDLQAKWSSLEEAFEKNKAELEATRDAHAALEKEYKMYKDASEEMIQEREREITELSASLKDSQTLARYKEASRPTSAPAEQAPTASASATSSESSSNAALPPQPKRKFSLENDLLGDISTSNIVEKAKMAASRDAFLEEYVKRIAELEAEALEYQKEISMREQLESVLKEELRKKEREETRSNLKGKDTDMEYLKNIVLKLLETGNYEVLLPVVSTLLALSPEEVERVRKAYQEGVHRQGSDPMDYATKAATDVTSYLSGWVFSSKK